MKKFICSFIYLLGCLGCFSAVLPPEPDEIIQLREDPPVNHTDHPQAPAVCPVKGIYVDGGVLIYGHVDGMITVWAEDEDGAIISESAGNLGEGVFVALPDSYRYVKITVAYLDRTFIAEILHFQETTKP